MLIKQDDPIIIRFVQAIQTGDVETLQAVLHEKPNLASKGIIDEKGFIRTPLHIVTDWPGYFPNGPVIVKILIDAGADPNFAATVGTFSETPLHWAASSDDVDVAIALIDGGADIGVLGGSITSGTPLDNAVGYGCWHVARLLVQRGAVVDKLWHAAALGMMARVEELMDAKPIPTEVEITEAFWQACSGGQRRVAEYLLNRGADLNGFPSYTAQSPLDAANGLDTRRETLVTWLKSEGAESGRSTL